MRTKEEVSELQISLVQNKSVLTTSKVLKPLKVFQLKQHKACQIVFSNYGGGFVEGDQILLDVICDVGTTTVFSSQANTRVYKSDLGLKAKQEITGQIGEGAFVVFIGDPLVPQQDSIFEQSFQWNLEENAVLLLVDWFEAGRLLNNERFAFKSFSSEMKVTKNDVTIVWDKFKIEPSLTNVNSPGAFLNHSSYLNIFLVGNESLERIQLLENHLQFLGRKYFQEDKPLKLSEVELLGATAKVNQQVMVVRCSAKSNEALRPFVKELASFLEDEKLLGYNPLSRKF
jgi:urease accessory protein